MTDNRQISVIGPRLLHYSQRPALKRALATMEQQHPYGDATGYKPRGLWLSVEGDDDWRSWCIAEGFSLENLRCVHEVVLKPSANILRIGTVEELYAFDEKYRPDTSAAAMHKDVGDPQRVRLLLDWSQGARLASIGARSPATILASSSLRTGGNVGLARCTGITPGIARAAVSGITPRLLRSV